MADDSISRLRVILQKVDFFNSLKLNDLDMLIQALRKRKAIKGDEIITQGTPGDSFYMISKGRVSVYVKKGMTKVKVAELRDGDFFGEMALVNDEVRNATIVADEPVECFVLYKTDFKKILLANTKISAIIKEVLSKRKRTNQGG